MTQRTFTGKTGDVWTWEETPETIKALKKLHETVKQVNISKLEAKAPDFGVGKSKIFMKEDLSLMIWNSCSWSSM